ncbi:PspA/IM30 family protein [Pseudomonas sp. HK3]
MKIWMKMITVLRGGANELGEAAVDAQALRILDQEIRDASEELKKSKDSLADIIARQKLAQEKANVVKLEIEKYEGYAIQALEKNDESLALEVAEKIAGLEAQFEQNQNSATEFLASAESLRSAINQADHNLKHLKQQIDTVKATESVQKAQAAVAQRHSGSNSKMRTAMDSLERIKEQQALKSAKLSAAQEVSSDNPSDSLQAKLEEAGIVSGSNTAADILEKLKNRK